ncbi:MAG: signal peptidase II [Buchananella hordeovulneris]|nr:signal peptidase II [Buchananella hordeovulneris]
MASKGTVLASVAGTSLAVVALDQGSKVWAVSALAGRERIDLLGKWFGLELHYNPGASFSFAAGSTWVFAVVALVTVAVIARYAPRITNLTWAMLAGTFLGGAVGNLIDRLFREPGFMRGHVVDFLAYGDWFIGNIADVALVGAAAAFMLLTVLGIEPWPAKEEAAPKKAAREAAGANDESEPGDE